MEGLAKALVLRKLKSFFCLDCLEVAKEFLPLRSQIGERVEGDEAIKNFKFVLVI